MIEYLVILSKEDAAKLAAKADEAGVVDDLEYLHDKIQEWLENNNNIADALAQGIKK